jgi:ribonuclease M5
MRPQVFVVEGKNDKMRLKSLFSNIEVLTTNGSAIDISTLDVLEKLDHTHDIILFLDPDHAGDRIRRIIGKKLTHVYHAFIDQEKAISENGKKIGVEHASDEVLKDSLHMIRKHTPSKSDITHSFLYEHKLTGSQNSKELRMKITKELHIGYVNGKTLYQRLHLFGITQKEVLEVIL